VIFWHLRKYLILNKYSSNMTMKQQSVQVLWNDLLAPFCYKIGLRTSDRFQTAVPGQFIMLRLGDHVDPLLRRPFSIHQLIIRDAAFQGIELLYKVVGIGTRKLSQLRPGDQVDILGPLGNGFHIAGHVQRAIIVAGGIGVAPMPFLAAHLLAKAIEPAQCKVFIGGKSKDDLLCREDFTNLGLAVHTTTDDGSSGDQCLVTDPVEVEISRSKPDIIFACGPMPMLSCVVGIAEKHGIECQVSIETMMACGMGACLGCAVESRKQPGRYLHTCLNGPVFTADALNL
jgi:dihydroorotate dehydrogenase electron transfer subunit